MAGVCPVDVSGLELTTSFFVCIQCHVVEIPPRGGVDGLKTKQSGILAIVKVGGIVDIKFGPSACFVQRFDLLASVTPVTFALAELLPVLVSAAAGAAGAAAATAVVSTSVDSDLPAAASCDAADMSSCCCIDAAAADSCPSVSCPMPLLLPAAL